MAALHVERTGAGDPVILLHGASHSGATYGWLPDLGRELVSVDLRGHGRSPRAAAYRLDDYVDDVLAVLRETGPAALVGHSLGAVVAWTLAQRQPALVRAIVLEDPPLYLGEPAEHAANPAIPNFRFVRSAAVRWQARHAEPAAVAAQLGALPYGPDPARRLRDVNAPDALAARADALLRVDPAVLDAVIDGSTLAGLDLTAPVAAPALILAADEALGPAFAGRHAQRLAATHPHVAVRRVAGAGHSIHDEREHRPAYLQAVRGHLVP